MRPESIRIATAGGRELAGRWWPGAEASERSLLCLSGIAARHEYFSYLAGFLADRGWGVLSFDYSGVASSDFPGSDAEVTADHWAEGDLPAALAELRRRSAARFVGVFAHSLGGQLLGISPIHNEIDAALLIASQHGVPRHFQGAARLRIEFVYRALPLVFQLLGRIPISSLTTSVHVPGRAVSQWIGWGRRGEFRSAEGASLEGRFAEHRAPITSISISDDDLATAAAVDALAERFTGSSMRRLSFAPAEFGAETLGHFGAFHRKAPVALWEALAGELDELVARAKGTSNAG